MSGTRHFIGVITFRYRQPLEEVERAILGDGVQSFHTALAGLLGAHLINYQIAVYTIRYLKTFRIGELLTPAEPALPEFVGVGIQSLPISPLLSIQAVVGDKVILDWGLLALSDATLEARELDIQIRQPVLAYYAADPDKGKLNVDEAVERLQKIADAWAERVGAHFALLDRLYDLTREVTRARPWLIRNYYTLHERPGVRKIRKEMKQGQAE